MSDTTDSNTNNQLMEPQESKSPLYSEEYQHQSQEEMCRMEKAFTNYTSDGGLVSRMNKNLI